MPSCRIKALRDQGREHRSGKLPPALEDGDKHKSLLKLSDALKKRDRLSWKS